MTSTTPEKYTDVRPTTVVACKSRSRLALYGSQAVSCIMIQESASFSAKIAQPADEHYYKASSLINQDSSGRPLRVF